MKRFQTFRDYASKAKRSGVESFHKARAELVEEYFPEIADEYQTLKENCWTARYDNYLIEIEIANLCVDSLASIAEICEPVNP